LKQIVFGGKVAAHLLHATLQMGCFSAIEEELKNQTKYSKIGVYESGRLISKPPPLPLGICCAAKFGHGNQPPDSVRAVLRAV